MLPNGVLLSCAFDGHIIAWNYLQTDGDRKIDSQKRKEELRCMDFIDWSMPMA